MRYSEVTRRESKIISENNSLSRYLKNLSMGRTSTQHSWLYEDESADTTLKKWIPLMRKGNSVSPFSRDFNMFDLQQVKKFGPQGGIPPIESPEALAVLDPLYNSSEFNDPKRLEKWHASADSLGRAIFRNVRRARPLPFESVIDDMNRRDTLTTNSGYPNFTRRRKIYERDVEYARSGEAYSFPAIVLFRFYYGKLRPVWMFPMSVNLIEASFQIPIQHELQNSPLPWVRQYCTPWKGFEYVKEVLTQQWQGQNIVGGDTTKMDAHMRAAQIELVYRVVRWLFQEKYWEELHRSLSYINHIELLVSTNSKLVGEHGLASGSSWTQLSETVLQLLIAYVHKVLGQGIGDDFYWIANLSKGEVVDALQEFGLPAQSQKQSSGNLDLTFLQRYYHQGFYSNENASILGAYYPTIRALNSLLWPEKFHDPKKWNSDMFCVRNYMILENCVDDPCFASFAAFVAKGQKDMIPFAKKSSSELRKIQKVARSLPGLWPSYNQEKINKPLSSFASIKLIRSL